MLSISHPSSFVKRKEPQFAELLGDDLCIKHLVLRKSLITLSFKSPILHTRKLGLSKAKEVTQGHQKSSNAGQESTSHLSELTLEHTPPSPPHRSLGRNQEKAVRKSCLVGESRKLSHTDFVPGPKSPGPPASLIPVSGVSKYLSPTASLHWDLTSFFL